MTYQFVNPYNFIPLGEKKSEAEERPEDPSELVTGYVDYTLLTKTPLFIPNTSNDHAYPQSGKVKDHKSYDFFSYTDLSGKDSAWIANQPSMPVIPGSEIRGMFRSNYEILTNSCMSSLDGDTIQSKRTHEAFKAGLLHRTVMTDGTASFELYEAEDCIARTKGPNDLTTDDSTYTFNNARYAPVSYIQDDLPEGACVTFDMVNRDGKKVLDNGREIFVKAKPLAQNVKTAQENNKGIIGYVLKGVKSPEGKTQKHCLHIFTLATKADPRVQNADMKKRNPKHAMILADASKAMKTMNLVLKEYENNRSGDQGSDYRAYHAQYKEFVDGKGNAYFPVYFSIVAGNEDQAVYLAPAVFTREIYQNTIGKLAGSYAPCTDKEHMCPACALFGMVNKDINGKTVTVASHVRFTDLTCSTGSVNGLYDAPITIQPLSTPKLNNMEFYLKKPEGAKFWTYDYYIDNAGKIHLQPAELNGRKFYWHHKVYYNDIWAEASNLNVTVHPLKADVKFKGRMYFNRISKDELKKLVWLLNTGDSGNIESHKHGYKLGMAKPYGFGSVAVATDKLVIRELSAEDGMVSMSLEASDHVQPDETAFAQDQNLEHFRTACGFDAVEGKNVTYPLLNGKGDDGFTWYTKFNHKAIDPRKGVVDMPNMRSTEIYTMHMQALTPELKETTEGFIKQVEDSLNNKKSNGSFQSRQSNGFRGGYQGGGNRQFNGGNHVNGNRNNRGGGKHHNGYGKNNKGKWNGNNRDHDDHEWWKD